MESVNRFLNKRKVTFWLFLKFNLSFILPLVNLIRFKSCYFIDNKIKFKNSNINFANSPRFIFHINCRY